jgi:ribonuclease HII
MVKGLPPEATPAQGQKYYEQHYGLICGVDEAGRGPLAGPVVAAAVILNPDLVLPVGLHDSKKINEKKREVLFGQICAVAQAWAIGEATPAEIDEFNILNATFLAMRRALAGLHVPTGHVLVDGNALIRQWEGPQTPIVKGDSKVACISAASILAKVHRDRLMLAAHKAYPEYGWDRNKGYPSAKHRQVVATLGLTPLHRKSFTVRTG